MTLAITLEGNSEEFGRLEQGMAKKNGFNGAIVFQERLLDLSPEFQFFLNPNFGASLNQNIGFGAIASVIHDGGTTSSADSGTTDGATTAFKLIQSGQNFVSTVVVGMSVQNTTDTTFSTVTAIDSNTQLSIADDIMATGENYTIDPVWVGTAVMGTWNFADAGKITLTSGVDGDTAEFDAAGTITYDTSQFTAFTGKVDLDTYSPLNNDITLTFDLAGAPVGNSISLNEFIDTGNFAEQNFVIALSEFGLETGIVDGLTVSFSRSGGPQGSFKLDDLQLEASGVPAVFIAQTAVGTKFHVDEILVNLVDVLPGTVTDGTMPGLAFNKILNVTKLANGLVFRRVQSGKVLSAGTVTQLNDFLVQGGNLINSFSDGTNTGITIQIQFLEPAILDGRVDDFISITVNDDMSGLLSFTAIIRGSVENIL